MNCANAGRADTRRLKIGSRKAVLSWNGAMQRTAYKDLDDISKKVATMTMTPAAHVLTAFDTSAPSRIPRVA
ncbi:MAG: hypothetical protein ACYCV7_13945 [Acidimicrobiales bacterium]